jgi:anti-sigma regulatory factor (Ser/Thr protein kinase)
VAFSYEELSEVQRFIIRALPEHPQDIAAVAGAQFKITRQAVGRHLRDLVARGVLKPTGETRNRRYEFLSLGERSAAFPITPELQEDVVWRDEVAPLLAGMPANVIDICRYGVTEIVNNAIDHSESRRVVIHTEYDASEIRIIVEDKGVGIFNKIKAQCGLEDERHAVLELSKGKLTTDPDHHTGEGIFFTSRMFDGFAILSGRLYVGGSRNDGDWLLETRDEAVKGTRVHLEISPMSTNTMTEVFNRYATDQDDYGFARTHVLVELAQHFPGEKFVSRSQAKRVMARLERFKEVVLDFRGIDDIGPAFADEIFRVFVNAHPETHVSPVNQSEPVARMIRRASSHRQPESSTG